MAVDWESRLKSELTDWKGELDELKNRPIDKRLIFDSAKHKAMHLLQREARAADLLPELLESLDDEDKGKGEEKEGGGKKGLVEPVSKPRGPRLKFKDLDIPIGAILDPIKTEDKAEVVDEKSRVRFRGEEMSLMEATREIPGLDANAKPSIRPASYWMYKDRLLEDIYNETHRTDD